MIQDTQQAGHSPEGAGFWSGRYFSHEDMALIRLIIAQAPQASRHQISQQICQTLDWRTPNGELKDMRARVVLLRMHEKGYIQLPPPRKGDPNQSRLRRKGPGRQVPSTGQWESDLHLGGPQNHRRLEVRVDQLGPLEIQLVSAQERRLSREWNALIDAHHYLGYAPVVGQQLRYFLNVEDQPVALASFGSAAWKVHPRDAWIGWTPRQRQSRLKHVINNTRFLILPWVRSPNLASAALSRLAKALRQDWLARYGVEPWLLETFVEQQRFAGTCYKAANWLCLGQTQGRGKHDRCHRDSLPIKDVLVYPLYPRTPLRLSAPTVDS